MKIAIFGAGNIGAAVANNLIVSDSLSQKIDSIALVDAVERIARGKALDLAHTAAVYERDLRISGSTQPGDIADAGIVVITAGHARKAGQSREELFGSNAAIVAQCARDAAKYAPNSIIIVVTNPLDLMVYAALQASGFAKERVIGMAGELDGARLKFELTRASGKEISSMRSAIVGPHSEEMIALKNELGFEISDEIFSFPDCKYLLYENKPIDKTITKIKKILGKTGNFFELFSKTRFSSINLYYLIKYTLIF